MPSGLHRLSLVPIITSKFSHLASEYQLILLRVAPLVFGCQDRFFELDGVKTSYPNVGLYAHVVVSMYYARQHQNLWRFNPSSIYGFPRVPRVKSRAKGRKPVTKLGQWKHITILVLIILFLAYLFPVFKTPRDTIMEVL